MRTTINNSVMNIKMPDAIVEAMKAAAQKKLMSRSEYVRQAILALIERDGICLVAA